MDKSISFTVNGKAHQVTTDSQRPLLDVLREDLHLHGTRFGCGEGDCGACSVLLGGKRIFSCQTDIADVEGKEITTIEGLAQNGKLHAVQEAFLAEGAYQCAYCVSGMIIAAVALLNENPHLTEEQIRTGMDKNLCRCCNYGKFVKAISRAAGGGVQ
ncbi:MAG TPA: (2Fe-2S)-binding protein [Phycisphaerae bacterium]|nr:(2Fe-2S)-binding protein [Phycisphaerae bacterium]